MNLSIILPVYDEEESLEPLVKKLNQFLADLDYDYEIIVVDDGSTDSSKGVIKNLQEEYSKVYGIFFEENRGKSKALQCGFQNAEGDIVFFMDSDLQYSPKDIPKYIEKVEEGYDVVNGWRVRRKDPTGAKLLPSLLYNLLTRFLLGPNIHDHNCGFKAFRKEAVKDLELKDGYHRYMLSILSEKGYDVGSIPIKHFPRRYGESKYTSPFRLITGFKDMVRVIFDFFRIKLNNSLPSGTTAPE